MRNWFSWVVWSVLLAGAVAAEIVLSHPIDNHGIAAVERNGIAFPPDGTTVVRIALPAVHSPARRPARAAPRPSSPARAAVVSVSVPARRDPVVPPPRAPAPAPATTPIAPVVPTAAPTATVAPVAAPPAPAPAPAPAPVILAATQAPADALAPPAEEPKQKAHDQPDGSHDPPGQEKPHGKGAH
jgi:hypothetical protein